MEIQIKPQFTPDSALIKLSGKLSARSADQLEDSFRPLLVQHRHLMIECSDLSLIDSTGLGALVRCLRAALSANSRLSLVALQKGPRMVLELTRTHQIFDIYDSVTGALQEAATPFA